VVGLYDDLHVLIEGDEEAQKALHATPGKVNSGTSAAKAVSGNGPLTQRWKRCSTQRRICAAPLRAGSKLEVVPFPVHPSLELRVGLDVVEFVLA